MKTNIPGAAIAAVLLAGLGLAPALSAAELAADAARAAPGEWSGSGSLTGHSMCTSTFSISYVVSDTGSVAGSLVADQGDARFRNTYQLTGRIDPTDGTSFTGEAGAAFVLKLEGTMEGGTAQGSISLVAPEECFGNWSAMHRSGGAG